jgi:hypothetical protein
MPLTSQTSTVAFNIASRRGSEVMFLFFSNRLGCVGSLILSAIVTVVLLLFFGVIRLH